MDVEDKTGQETRDELTELHFTVAELEDKLRALAQEREELRRAAERLELALEGAEVGVWDYNLQTGEAFVSPLRASMVGYSLEEVEPHFTWWGRQVHPDDLTRVRKAFNAHVKGRTPFYECEHRLRCKSGEYKWILARAKIAERDKDGNPVRIVGTSLDITDHKRVQEALKKAHDELDLRVEERTAALNEINDNLHLEIAERKRAEEALRQSEEKFRLMFEFSPLGVFHFDKTGTITACNDNFVTIIGSSREKLIGLNTIRDLKDTKMMVAINEAVSGGMGSYEGSYTSVTAQKTTPVKCEFAPIVSQDGTVLGGIGIVEDATGRKRAEEALRESEERYRAVFNNAAAGIILLDRDDNFMHVNSTAESIYGCVQNELGSRSFYDVTHPEDVDVLRRELLALQQGKQDSCRLEKRFLRRDGKVIWAELSVSALRNVKAEYTATLAVIVDITERKRLEEQLRQSAKMEAIGQLAGGVAHDFNNILTAVIGYANLLSNESPASKSYQERLLHLTRAAERAADLTRQLLAFSRKQVLDVKVFYLNEIIRDTERLLKRLIGENIDLVTDLNPSAGTVQADPVQIQQILMNLAVNARDAMPGGGRLAIETNNVCLSDDYARMYPEVRPGQYVLFTVSDSGQGMDSQTLGRMFEPFFTTKEKGVGTGLGLATVYGIVKQHLGHISVYSEPGRGTTFNVFLPRIEALPDSSVETWELGQRPQGNETVLVVEDETMVRTIACEALEILGYKTLSASEPSEAIEISSAHVDPIHLLLTDVVLPQMDGRHLYEALSSKRPGLKVLYMSGYTENFVVHGGVLDKDTHFMQKPFDVDHLARKVRETLDGP